MPGNTPYEQIQEVVGRIRARTEFSPEVGVVLGSGLGPLGDEIEVVADFPYAELPHFPRSTAPGHEGRLILGYLEGKRVLAYKGRVHVYEGYTPAQVVFPVRVGFFLGARAFLVTSAAGGLNPAWNAGELMLHSDYINYAALSPLTGPNDERLGPRFPVTFDAYDLELRALAHKVARAQDFTLREGVYAWWPGPQFASRAELRVLRTLGADAIGMSTVPEVIALRHLGARVLGLSTITDMAVPERDHHATEQEVLATAARSGALFRRFVRGILAAM
ncbi:Purine nucleoside phosphorylase 1 [Meiothermus luteus]|jgi:purine-nucleoside phosphorylase|uniref:Purine nucleoside phosphorylase n=1 Tax=Meiothermus luteus TaxID=2026184 RepID=A0A399ELV1_9DEIN|nr:purine-nucleoside phosphorylase [Meiothermus luteus]RIH83412.1 Purine nucleoside phosphorylase 1 [Meiothermus luteus]